MGLGVSEGESGVWVRLLTGEKKLLTAEEERDLVEKAQAGDKRAGDKLMTAHLPFVISEALRLSSNRRAGEELDAIIAEGVLGMAGALPGFDLSRGVRFNTYVRWFVLERISDMLHKESAWAKSRRSLVSVSHYSKGHYWGPSAGDEMVSLLLREPSRQTELLVRKRRKAELRSKMGELTKREQRVMRERLEGRTQAEAGAAVGVCRTRGQQIEHEAIGKLKADYSVSLFIGGVNGG